MTGDPFAMITKQVHGSAGTHHDRRYPTLEADGSLHVSEHDGTVLGPIAVKGISWVQATMALKNLVTVQQETVWRYFDVQLYLTDSRLVVVVDKPVDHSTQWVGHLRYPWIASVGYRPKQSFLYECELVIGMEQPPGNNDEMPVDCTLRIFLDRHVDSAGLARRVVRRVARHHLDRGSLPATAVPGFQILLDPPHLPAPKKGGHAMYWMGAFKHFPTGTEYLNGQPEQGTWRGRDTTSHQPQEP